MLIAIVNGQTVEQVGDYQSLFPDISFPPSGPDAEWMAENSCLPVSIYLPYDKSTQYLEAVAPYRDVDTVYTIVVAQMSPEMIAQYQNSLAQQIAAQGKQILSNTDWTAIASIADPTESNPYLTNRPDFLTYRSAVRAIVLNPSYDSVYPVAPIEHWSNELAIVSTGNSGDSISVGTSGFTVSV